MNLSQVEVDNEIKKLKMIESCSDTTIEFETKILPSKQLCCWYRGNIAVIRSAPYVVFVRATDDLAAVCRDSAGNVLFSCYSRGKNDFTLKADPFFRNDVDLLQALKNEKNRTNDIRLQLKTNRIEVTIFNSENGKKKKFQVKMIDVLKAVNKAVSILDNMQNF